MYEIMFDLQDKCKRLSEDKKRLYDALQDMLFEPTDEQIMAAVTVWKEVKRDED